MKEIRILFDSFLLDKVVSEIKEFGIERYLVISKIKGEWRSDLKHFDNSKLTLISLSYHFIFSNS